MCKFWSHLHSSLNAIYIYIYIYIGKPPKTYGPRLGALGPSGRVGSIWARLLRCSPRLPFATPSTLFGGADGSWGYETRACVSANCHSGQSVHTKRHCSGRSNDPALHRNHPLQTFGGGLAWFAFWGWSSWVCVLGGEIQTHCPKSQNPKSKIQKLKAKS